MTMTEIDPAFRALRQRARVPLVADVTFAERNSAFSQLPTVLSAEGLPLFAIAVADGAAGPQPATWSLQLQDQANSVSLKLSGEAIPVAADAAELRARFEAFFPDRLNTAVELWQLKPTQAVLDGKELGGGQQWLLPEASWYSDRQYITDHMNEDHVKQMLAMCRHFFDLTPQQVTLIALDSEGMHLRADERLLYLPFAMSCDSTREVAMETVRLSIEAGAGPDYGAASKG